MSVEADADRYAWDGKDLGAAERRFCLQYLFQAMGWSLPYQLFLALPYLATLIALATARAGGAAPGALGRVADVAGYPASYLVSAVLQVGALPFLWLARREKAESDAIEV